MGPAGGRRGRARGGGGARAWQGQRGSGQAQPAGARAGPPPEEERWERAVGRGGAGGGGPPLFSARSAFNGRVEVREYDAGGGLRLRGLEFCAGGGEGLFQGMVPVGPAGRPTPGARPEFGYVRTMASCLALCAGALGSGGVLCLGLGAGCLPAVVGAAFPRGPPEVDVCEIDPEVVRAAALHLGFRAVGGDAKSQIYLNMVQRGGGGGGGRPRLWIGDGAAHVAATAEAVISGRTAPLAAILLDAFDGKNDIPAGMASKSFLAMCFDCLAPGGALVCNLQNGWWGSPERDAALAYMARLRSDAACGSLISCVPRDMPQNVVAAALKGVDVAADEEHMTSAGAFRRAADRLVQRAKAAGGAFPFDPAEELCAAGVFSVGLVGNMLHERAINK